MDSIITPMDFEFTGPSTCSSPSPSPFSPSSFSSSPIPSSPAIYSYFADGFPLLELPPLVLVVILGSLSAQDVASASQSCETLFRLSQHNAVWKRVAKRRWNLRKTTQNNNSSAGNGNNKGNGNAIATTTTTTTAAAAATASGNGSNYGYYYPVMRPARWKHYYKHKLAVMREGAFSWESLKMEGDPITKRYQHTGSAVGKDLYFIGGQELPEKRFDEIYVLHTDTMKSEKVNPISGLPPKFARHTAVTIGTNIYLFGGFDGVSKHFHLSIFDTLTTEWTCPKVAGVLPPSRTNHSAVTIGSKMYIFGGMYKDTSLGHDKLIFLNDMFVLNTEGTLEWKRVQQKGQLPSPRCGHRMVAFGDILVLFGGGCGEQWDSKFSDVYVFDTTTGEWVKPSINGSAPVCTFTVAFSAGVFLFIFGGQSLTDNNLTNELYCLDTVSMTWTNVTTAGSKPGARDMASGNIIGDNMFMFGGYCGNAIDSLFKLQMDPAISALPTPSLSPFA